MAVSIFLNAINVFSMQSNSSVAVGENAQSGWVSHNKSNNGTSPQGTSLTSTNLITIIDPDAIDSVVNDQEFDPTELF